MSNIRFFIALAEAASANPWETIMIDGVYVHVGWDPDKEIINLKKHHMSLAMGKVLLKSNPETTGTNVRGEDRIEVLGKIPSGQYLFAAIQVFNTGEDYDSIRIISVREANKNERKRLVRKVGMAEDISIQNTSENENEESAIAKGAATQSLGDYLKKRQIARLQDLKKKKCEKSSDKLNKSD